MHPTILEQFKKGFKLNENDLFIIQYIIEHSEEITSYSSHQLAKETYSSPTAIIRLVKKIGFKNYNDFKLNIHSLLNKYTLSNMRIMSNEDLYTIKNKLAEIETGIINQTKEHLNSNVFNEVMTMISRNKYIDIIANDANTAISEYGSHILSVSAKLYSVPKKDDQIIFDLIVLYFKLFFYLFTPWHEPVNLFWMLNDINLRHYI